jgi:hypothetical protein
VGRRGRLSTEKARVYAQVSEELGKGTWYL